MPDLLTYNDVQELLGAAWVRQHNRPERGRGHHKCKQTPQALEPKRLQIYR